MFLVFPVSVFLLVLFIEDVAGGHALTNEQVRDVHIMFNLYGSMLFT